MYTTTLCVVLLQTLTMTHMLPMSAPIRTAEELNQMIDPVFQSEQDENQLESKKIVAKSVYNTVIRVTTTPCQSGMQRVKEGGPCVTRYTGSGPVFDEEFQLSILKGITGGGRRPTSSKHRNRHRTTTTPIPSTTTAIETAAPTTWGLPPTAAENVENEGEYGGHVTHENKYFFFHEEEISTDSATARVTPTALTFFLLTTAFTYYFFATACNLE